MGNFTQTMRPLSPEETRMFFEKLANFIGRKIKTLLDAENGKFVFRIHDDRIYYVRKDLLGFARAVPKNNMMCAGTCFAKIQRRTREVRLMITSLSYLAQFAKYKVWIKPKAEMSFVYGNHVLKAQVLRMTEMAPQNHGVVVFNQMDVPMGFGTLARPNTNLRMKDPTAIVVFNQRMWESTSDLRARCSL